MSEDIEELARFRREWQAEVASKRAPKIAEVAQSLAAPTLAKDLGADNVVGKDELETPHIFPRAERPSVHAPAVQRSIKSAVDHYRAAVSSEERGELDDALHSYRLAFRMEPNVDKMYLLQEKKMGVAAVKSTPDTGRTSPTILRHYRDHDRDTRLQEHRTTTVSVVSGTITSIVEGFPLELAFEPPPRDIVEPDASAEDVKGKGKAKLSGELSTHSDSVPISLLPEELMVYILHMLDPNALERFATVNRKARVLTLDSSVWRELVTSTYKPPQLPDLLALENLIEQFTTATAATMGTDTPQLVTDYRRLYVEQPRVRFDGVYIAICHYIRSGLSENQWVQVSHLITYHRYLRFYNNGQVLSLLANEELGPQKVVPLLQPSLRMKGFFIGTWRLDSASSQILIEDLYEYSDKQSTRSSKRAAAVLPDYLVEPMNQMALVDAKLPRPYNLPSSQPYQGQTSSSLIPPPRAPRYVFRMTLDLRSRPNGRWNHLKWVSYASVDRESGDASPFPLRNERAFWFSKVRSYAP